MRILVVEDEETLAQRIANILEGENYSVETAFRGDDGLEMALTEEYDLLLLDILLPGRTGIEILEEIRKEGLSTPVLMLTAQDRVEDKVKGLDAGADDYLTKPFAPPELLARIRSLLRRQSEATTASIEIGDISIHTGKKEVSVKGEVLSLTAKEFAILKFMAYNKNRVLSRISISEHVWGDNFDLFSMTNFLDVHIKNLRKKVLTAGGENPIKTVRGVGYMLEG